MSLCLSVTVFSTHLEKLAVTWLQWICSLLPFTFLPVNSLDLLALPPSHSPDAEGFVPFLGHTYAPRASSHPRTFAPARCHSAYKALLSDRLKVLT